MNYDIENVLGREYPNPMHHNVEIKTRSGVQRYPFPDSTFLQNKILIGIFIRKQNENNTRKSKTGTPLLNVAAMEAAHLTLGHGAVRIHEDTPLEFFVHEGAVNTPGTYAQIFLPHGFETSSSYIDINDATTIVDNESIEFVLVYLDKTCAPERGISIAGALSHNQ